jgi:hypothetical protein
LLATAGVRQIAASEERLCYGTVPLRHNGATALVPANPSFCRDSLRFVEVAVAIDFVISAGITFALAP